MPTVRAEHDVPGSVSPAPNPMTSSTTTPPLRVGVLLGERLDLLWALLDVTELEVVAVARDRREADAPPPPGLPRELFGWWPERGPGARERREDSIARWFHA